MPNYTRFVLVLALVLSQNAAGEDADNLLTEDLASSTALADQPVAFVESQIIPEIDRPEKEEDPLVPAKAEAENLAGAEAPPEKAGDQDSSSTEVEGPSTIEEAVADAEQRSAVGDPDYIISERTTAASAEPETAVTGADESAVNDVVASEDATPGAATTIGAFDGAVLSEHFEGSVDTEPDAVADDEIVTTTNALAGGVRSEADAVADAEGAAAPVDLSTSTDGARVATADNAENAATKAIATDDGPVEPHQEGASVAGAATNDELIASISKVDATEGADTEPTDSSADEHVEEATGTPSFGVAEPEDAAIDTITNPDVETEAGGVFEASESRVADETKDIGEEKMTNPVAAAEDSSASSDAVDADTTTALATEAKDASTDAGEESLEGMQAPGDHTQISRVTTDEELATAAANVRKSWLLATQAQLDSLTAEKNSTTDETLGVPMKVAMLAAGIANIVADLDVVKQATKPLVFIRGKNGLFSEPETTTSAPSIMKLLPKNLKIPFLNPGAAWSTVGQSAMSGQQQQQFPVLPAGQQFPAPLGQQFPVGGAPLGQQLAFGQQVEGGLRSSPYSSLWPHGTALAKPEPARARMNSLVSLSKTTRNMYKWITPRRLAAGEPAARERFGNFLHDELPKEIKRKIWSEFLEDSRRARSVEEQNALLRKLERGQDEVRTSAAPSRGYLQEESTPFPIERARRHLQATLTPAQKIEYVSRNLARAISSGSIDVYTIEAARLYLATLEPASQQDLMALIARDADAEFDGFLDTHPHLAQDFHSGLLFLTRLKRHLPDLTADADHRAI